MVSLSLAGSGVGLLVSLDGDGWGLGGEVYGSALDESLRILGDFLGWILLRER